MRATTGPRRVGWRSAPAGLDVEKVRQKAGLALLDLPVERPRRAAAESRRDVEEDRGLAKGELKVLTAIAQHRDGVTRAQLTLLTGYRETSLRTYLGKLFAKGSLQMAPGGFLGASPEGVALLGPNFERLPTGGALRAYWLEKLPAGETKVLAAVVERYPVGIERAELMAKTGYRETSLRTYLGKLRARRLVQTGGHQKERPRPTTSSTRPPHEPSG